MAAIKIYGHAGCCRTQDALRCLEELGVPVEACELGQANLDASLKQRIAALENSSTPKGKADAADHDLHSVPLAVRGGRVVLGDSPARLSSLIY